jgi:hypothetical protein
MSIRFDIHSAIEKGLIPKQALDIILCYFSKRMIYEKKFGVAGFRHRFMVVGRYEKFKMKNRVILISPSGKALCLLKTQFAKKPKNPV